MVLVFGYFMPKNNINRIVERLSEPYADFKLSLQRKQQSQKSTLGKGLIFMRVFSLNFNTTDFSYVSAVWSCIQENVRYFKKFNGAQYEEAMHLVLVRALRNKKTEYTDLTPYIKKLARTELKQKQRDVPLNYTDEETGEVSKQFIGLAKGFSVMTGEQSERLKNVFRDMYLMHPDEIIALRPLFEDIRVYTPESKAILAKVSDEVKDTLWSAISRINNSLEDGGKASCKAIMEFYDEIARADEKQFRLSGTKNIVMTAPDYRCMSRIPVGDTIVITSGSHKGEQMGIDTSKTLEMTSDVNLDLVSWLPISKTRCDVIKIDISEYINYLYDNIYVDKGVNTPHRKWLGNRYALTSPAGKDYLNEDEEVFISKCIEELILNLIANNVNNIIGFTSDSIYVRPIRKITYDTIRCKIFNNKFIDLNLSYHVTK